MSKPAPARYRTTNWPEYNAALRRRGSLLVWLDREMEWFATRSGRPLWIVADPLWHTDAVRGRSHHQRRVYSIGASALQDGH